MTDIPLAALGRLNAHAREQKSWGQSAAIYAYKSFAAMTLACEKKLQLRCVSWTGRCNRCTDGRFRHYTWDDGYSVRCRDCGGSGRRTLDFAETTLPDGQVWHHPWLRTGFEIARALLDVSFGRNGEYRTPDGAVLVWHEPGEWQPLLPGRRLALAELVADLNAVEDWVQAATTALRGSWWWIGSDAKRHLCRHSHARVTGEPSHGYMLDLGRAPGGCFVCGDETDLDGICIGRMTPLLHWSLPVCKAHRNAPHPKDPPPAALITPEIRRWLDRHEHVEEIA